MKTTRLNDNLIQVTRLHFVNAYLVREDDGFTLVDTTVGGGAKGLIATAAAAGGEIKRIVLTHGHGDHIGSLAALKQRLGDGATSYLHELDARIIAGETVVDGKVPGSWPKQNTALQPDVALEGGERIGSLEVIPTPGHSPGHVALRDVRDGTVIAGDVFTSYGHLAVTNHRNLRFPLAVPATWDRAKDLEAARMVQSLQPQLLVVGHGPAIAAPATAITEAIERSAAATGAR